MSHVPCITSHYLHGAFQPERVRGFINGARDVLARYEFDAIAFRGMSGALVAPLLAYELGKTLIMVRKPKSGPNDHHSMHNVEGDRDARRYLIVDDFRCSGDTIRAILGGISIFAPDARCMGVMFYQCAMLWGRSIRVEATREMIETRHTSIFTSASNIPYSTEIWTVDPGGKSEIEEVEDDVSDVPF